MLVYQRVIGMMIIIFPNAIAIWGDESHIFRHPNHINLVTLWKSNMAIEHCPLNK